MRLTVFNKSWCKHLYFNAGFMLFIQHSLIRAGLMVKGPKTFKKMNIDFSFKLPALSAREESGSLKLWGCVSCCLDAKVLDNILKIKFFNLCYKSVY